MNVSSETIPAPQETRDGSFTTNIPCTQFQGDYSGLGAWWRDYVQMCLTESPDVDVLLTNHDGQLGVNVGNQYALVEGGCNIANLPTSWQEYNDGKPFRSMQTALHEMAHGILDGPSGGPNGEPSFKEHEVGETYPHGDINAKSPFADSGSTNPCGRYIEAGTGYYKQMEYSECCEDRMKHV